MKYKILEIEKKVTSTGKNMAKATLEGMDGSNVKDVAIWDGFPNFTGLVIGSEIEGDMVEKQNGQYLNRSLYAPKTPYNAQGGTRMAGVAKAQEKKAEYIREAQDRKSESIAFFNATNSAIQLLEQTSAKLMSSEEIKQFLQSWRTWFIMEWEEWDAKDYQDKHKAF